MSDNTVANVLVALLTRVYVGPQVWNPPHRATNRVVNRSASLAARQVSEPMSPDEVREHMKSNFPPAKADMYMKTLDEPFVMRYARLVTTFIKAEWVWLKPGKFYKPRVIQFRRPAFLAQMYYWYKPMEHVIYHGRYIWNSKQARCCAKGRNLVQRMGDLLELVARIPSPVVVDLDGSAFDAHVSKEALKLEWKWYLKVAKAAGWSREVRAHIVASGKAQLRNKCVANLKDGQVKYVVEGNRMSGDLNTAGGNTCLMMIFLSTFCSEFRIPDTEWGMYDDGDDCVFIVSEKWVPLLKAELVPFFNRFNQELKMGAPRRVSTTNMEPIDFCQCRPVLVEKHWRLVKDPVKQMCTYLCSHRWFTDRDMARRFWATISPPEMIMGAGVPMLDAFYTMLRVWGGGTKPLKSVARNFWRREATAPNVAPSEISGTTRESFAKAFLITCGQQTSVEGSFRGEAFDPTTLLAQ